MKKIVLISLLFFVTLLFVILTTIGFETNKFNNLISEKVKISNPNIDLNFEKIKFKLDIKNLNLFVETNNPKFSYKDVKVPIENVKVYLNPIGLLKSQLDVKYSIIQSKEININQLKKIILETKPSNLSSLIMNNVKEGFLKTSVEFYFDEDFEIKNYIARGELKKINFVFKKFKFKNTEFKFFADNSDILLKDIKSEIDGVVFNNGDLQINYEKNINIKSSFFTSLNLNRKQHSTYFKLLEKNKDLKGNIRLNADLNHNLDITFDKTMKVSDYNYANKGKIKELFYQTNNKDYKFLLNQNIKKIKIENSEINAGFNSDSNNYIISSGNYKLNDLTLDKYSITSKIKNNIYDLSINLDYSDDLNYEIINYRKDEGKIANITLDINVKGDEIHLKKVLFKENNNKIFLKDLKFSKTKFVTLNKIDVKTFDKKGLQNSFEINYDNNLRISGKKYDAANLYKFINKKTTTNNFKTVNKDIEINLEQVLTPLSETLKNFRLIGKIKKGKFDRLSAKGDFKDDNFLDISLKQDKNTKKKQLEIYSDIPQPLLSEYSFFKGLTGGKLLFSSLIGVDQSNSKLIIENFKIQNAPAVVKLLSIADFGGLADLAEGEGLSFEKLEITMSNNSEILKLEELYAVGPSISVLMEGYKDNKGLTSLRGTLVPAKTLNKLIAKIPVIGNIVIPKDVGEGLFGVSFKMKGPPGKIKTTINPIKTLTPRFITKALEKSKKSK